MSLQNKIRVPNLSAKLDLLFQHAVRRNGADMAQHSGRPGRRRSQNKDASLPENKRQLADRLNSSGVAGAGKLDGSRLKAAEESRPFTEAMHVELLKVYGIEWPCWPYYDSEGRNRDKQIESFQRIISLCEGGIDLVHVRKNRPDFPLADIYVMSIDECSVKLAYEGDITAKCSTLPIVGDKEPLLGLAIGEAGFSRINLSIEWPDGADVTVTRPDEMAKGAPPDIEVLDRGSQGRSSWRVQTLSPAGPPPLLDTNIGLCRMTVVSLTPGQELVIRTTAPMPTLKLSPNTGVQNSDELRRYERLAQNQILAVYREGLGSLDDKRTTLTLGEIRLKLRDA